MKKCSKCKKEKEDSEFYVDNRSKSGLGCWCKQCCHEYYEKTKVSKKTTTSKSSESRQKAVKKYNDKTKEKRQEYYEQPVKYSDFCDRLKLYINIYCNEEGLLEVPCQYCGSKFAPKRSDISNFIAFINGKHGMSSFYCSESCKHACPMHYQKKYPKNKKPIKSNEVRSELRKMVLELDNWTCMSCGKSKKEFPELELHCHHIDPVVSNPIESADIDNCITLCKECHQWIHQNIPGCLYSDLIKCNKTKKEK